MQRIPFAKLFVIFASAFGIALGMCGLSLVMGISLPNRMHVFFGSLVGLEASVMLISLLGLFVTFVLWVIAAIVRTIDK